MATYYKRKGRRGVRWTVRVRIAGREVTKTFATKGAAETWAKAQELAIETGNFAAAQVGAGAIFADLVDAFLVHRRVTRRPLGKTASHVLARLKDEHGLEPASTLSTAFVRRHALRRMADGVASPTAIGYLAYADSVLAHAKRGGAIVDASGPAAARADLADEGLRVASRAREC